MITLHRHQWAKIKEQLKEEYKETPSVMLFRMKMKTVLGFTVRDYWDDDVERRHIVYLDFFDEQKETVFILKYL